MEFVNVLVAAAAAYAFGAVWYMSLARQWLAASGIPLGPNGKPVNGSGPLPFLISAVSMVIVAGMMRHVFAMSGLTGVGGGLMGGFGLGLFIVLPWIVTNYAYAMRPRALMLIDGTYAVAGCTLMGVVLGLF